jgi:uncharacterized protein (TIGR02996 family)
VGMSNDQALLAAIIANPDDDLPRLVYADWLTEHGQPERADFIRFQVAVERTPPESAEHRELRRSAARLLAVHRGEWLRENEPSIRGARYHFRRGFVEVAEVDALVLVNRLSECRYSSTIRDVIARDAVYDLTRLAQQDSLRRFRVRARLDFGDRGPPILMDLLRPAAESAEPFLLRGRWLVLCHAIWSSPDRETLHRLVALHRMRRLPVGVAVRPFDAFEEFETWCAVRETSRSPIWLILEDGELVETVIGVQPPSEFRAGWDATA